jgi:hypothetical protein
MNGKHMNSVSIEQTKPTTIILLLSKDSLILGNEAYFGKDHKYGYDDWYYVPAEN